MALITCPECGQQVSDTAKTCPHCGFVLKKTVNIDFAAGAQKASEAVNAIRDVKKVVNPFKVFDYKDWAIAFKCKKFWLYTVLSLAILILDCIAKGVGYSLVILLVPIAVLILRAITEALLDNECLEKDCKIHTLLPYDDLVFFTLAYAFAFKGWIMVIALSVSVMMAVMSILKMAAFKQLLTDARQCPECGHDIAKGETECPHCSFPAKPAISSIPTEGATNRNMMAAICFVAMLVFGLAMTSALSTKNEALKKQCGMTEETDGGSGTLGSSKRWICNKCNKIEVTNDGLKPMLNGCSDGWGHSWHEY